MGTILKIIMLTVGGYMLTVHLVYMLGNSISKEEARKKVNNAIIDFFSTSEMQPETVPDILCLMWEEWRELEQCFEEYYLKVRLDRCINHRDGTISLLFIATGMFPKYTKHIEIVMQFITKDVTEFLLQKLGGEYPIHIQTCNGYCVHIVIAYSKEGWEKIQRGLQCKQMEKQRRRGMYGKRLIKKPIPNSTKYLCLGLRYKEWHEKNAQMFVSIDLRTHPHLLLCGSSGSGKSYALNYYVWQLLNKHNLFTVWFGDYKNSEDFQYLHAESSVHYASGNDVEEMVSAYYQLFCDVRDKKREISQGQMLVLDEYPSWIQMLEMEDKKKAEKYKGIIGMLLMMGRSLSGVQFGVIITAQRPDAALFPKGGRDNFMSVIALGMLSAEAKAMVTDRPSELPRTTYKCGEGIARIDGMDEEIIEIFIPQIKYPS